MGERVGQIAKVPEVKQSNSNSRVRRTERLQSIDTPVDRILYLQRTAGNQAVSRLMRAGALQAKLRIGQPGDVYEQEADRVADAVMRMPELGVQRQVEKEEKEETFQAKGTSGHISEVTPDLESSTQALVGGGQSLPESARAFFEPRFDYDFSQVRIHTDAEADTLSRGLNARAFTTSHDIFFQQGAYSTSSSGQELLGHELTHVVQQGRAKADTIQMMGTTIGKLQDAFEKEDPEITERILKEQPVSCHETVGTPSIQRQAGGGKKEPKEIIRKKFMDSIKISVWPLPIGGNINWVVDPMNIWLAPYSDEVNPGIRFFTYFDIKPKSYLDSSGTSPMNTWPLNGKIGYKYDFFLKGANDFDLDIELRFLSLKPSEHPLVTKKVHIKDKRKVKQPEIPSERTVTVGGVKEEWRTEYKVVNGELFIADPLVSKQIRPEDFNQAFLGTCYFLASLAAVTRDHPRAIRRMIKDNKNGTYTVTFYEDKSWFGKPDYIAVNITIDNKLPFLVKGGQRKYLSATPVDVSAAGAELWGAIIEKAYAQWKGGYPDIEGGWPVKALPEITGVEAKVYSTSDLSDKELLNRLSTALLLGNPVVASAIPSFKEWLFDFLTSVGEEARKKLDVYYSHAYTIMEVDVQGRRIQLRNPWGINHPHLTVELFRDYFKQFTISSL